MDCGIISKEALPLSHQPTSAAFMVDMLDSIFFRGRFWLPSVIVGRILKGVSNHNLWVPDRACLDLDEPDGVKASCAVCMPPGRVDQPEIARFQQATFTFKLSSTLFIGWTGGRSAEPLLSISASLGAVFRRDFKLLRARVFGRTRNTTLVWFERCG